MSHTEQQEKAASRRVEVISGAASLIVDPAVGGRIVELRLAGRNLLTPPEVHPDNFGSTLWTSPQHDWDWPPPAEVDTAPYDCRADADGVALVGPTAPRLGVRLHKRVLPGPASESFGIEYGMENTSDGLVTYAPWEVTRWPRRGLSFFDGSARCLQGSTTVQTQDPHATWIDHAGPIVQSRKLFFDSEQGWIAHFAPDFLWAVCFEPGSGNRAAPREAAIEIYENAAPGYIELEPQGAYRTIAPGARYRWQTRWRVAPCVLPQGPGIRAELVRRARALIEPLL